MIADSFIFHAVLFGLAIAFGIGVEKARISLRVHRRKKARREYMGFGRRDPEPVWARWSPEIGRAISGRKDAS